jgi:hypothetical protein
MFEVQVICVKEKTTEHGDQLTRLRTIFIWKMEVKVAKLLVIHLDIYSKNSNIPPANMDGKS